MASLNVRMTLPCVALALCGLLAPSAQAQDVSFIAPLAFPAGRGPVSIAVGDFIGDGVQDMAACNSYGDDVSVLLGNGNGSFQAARNFVVGNTPISVAMGDFNGDGRLDLVAAFWASDNVSVLLGNGDGTFQ